MVVGNCVYINYNYHDVDGNPNGAALYNDSFLALFDHSFIYSAGTLRLYKNYLQTTMVMIQILLGGR